MTTTDYSRAAYACFINKTDKTLRQEIYLAAGRAALGEIRPGSALIVAALHKVVSERAEWSPLDWAGSVDQVARIVRMVAA